MELTQLDEAETVDEAVVIAQNAGIPAQNFIVGDRKGKIAWTIAGPYTSQNRGLRSNDARRLEHAGYGMERLAYARAVSADR